MVMALNADSNTDIICPVTNCKRIIIMRASSERWIWKLGKYVTTAVIIPVMHFYYISYIIWSTFFRPADIRKEMLIYVNLLIRS